MRLEQLQYIMKVDKHKSVTKAAKELYVTQPALSKAISSIENKLNTKIFHRTTNGVETTEQGKVILQKVTRILREIEDINELCLNSRNIKETMKISTLPAVSNYILLEVLTLFQEQYPRVDVLIKEDDTRSIIRDLKAGEIDFGIIALTNEARDEFFARAKESNIQYEDLFTDELCIFVAYNHPLLQNQQIDAKEIGKFKMVLFKHNMRKHYIENFIQRKDPNIIRFSNIESMKKVVARSTAVAFLPRIASLNDIYVSSGEIVPLTIASHDLTLYISIVYPKNHLSITQREFINILKKFVHNLPLFHNEKV